MTVYKQHRYGSVLAKDKILLFGDAILTSRILGKVLKRRNYFFKRITEPSNILNDISLFNPKIVILDYSSDEIDCIKLCRKVKFSKSIEHIPVIVIGKHVGSSSHAIKFLEAGADDYVSKPLNIPLFLARLKVILTWIFAEENLVKDFAPIRHTCSTDVQFLNLNYII